MSSVFSYQQEEKIRKIAREEAGKLIREATWDGPSPTEEVPHTYFLGDGWSDEPHPLGGFWSQRIEEYRKKLEGSPVSFGPWVSSLLQHPYLNCAWIADFSVERKQHLEDFSNGQFFQQMEVNLSHFSFQERRIPGGGKTPKPVYDRSVTFPEAYFWEIRTNRLGNYAGADPVRSDSTCRIFLRGGLTDEEVAFAVMSFAEDYLRQGPLKVEFEVLKSKL